MLMAGFSGNGFNYDIAFERSNFALYLARRGFDVWVCNFRGTGREPYRSDGGDYSHFIQDLGIYDLPALIEAVTARTGKKPVIVGHSMGGVVCYGYLQGVEYVRENGRECLRPRAGLVRERNESVAAAVSLAGPASFYWPRDSRFYWILATPLSRAVLRAQRALLARICRHKSQVPIESSVVKLIERAPAIAYLLLSIGYSFFANLKNMNREMLMESAISGLSDVSFRQQYQLVNALLTGDLIGSRELGPDAATGHNFTANMHLISAPILFVAAELDAVNPAILYRDGFERVSSDIRDFKSFDGYGHIDLLQGIDAGEQVFPYVADWINKVVEHRDFHTGVRPLDVNSGHS
jgi:pimeloyl-ACP methyl ester carboxylesterase